ncbi:uncharacterized protein LOC126658024 [Mercurialis annua]|uniref:uncharacterized protein LOC126658024 n=1 Tax=Mercurialis annua TaxID=3986 RepID=UPI002160506E|nr:uncharacterized protein LOC126658024 [Mercurialis annua]
MATAAVSSNHQDTLINQLHSESLPQVDLRLLSQSELLSLSFCCSSSSLNNHRQIEADVATLKIDRSVFNESAGSRKQTFYKLRLAPRNSNSVFSPSPSSSIRPHKNFEVPLDEDNSEIVGLLRSLFGCKSESTENEKENCNSVDNSNLVSDVNLMAVPIAYNESFEEALKNLDVAKYGEEAMKQSVATDSTSSNKRKRGRPRISTVNGNVKVNENVIGEQQNQVSVVTDSKRKRGRPRKDSSTLDVTNTINVNMNQERPVIVVEKEVTLADTDSLAKESSMLKNSSNLDADNDKMGVNVNVNEDVQVVVVMNEVESGKNEVESGKNEVDSGKKEVDSGKKEVQSVKKVVENGKKVESGGGVEDWYGGELRKRTMGMQTQAEVFGALEGLEGEWMSKRKKRKIVDASLLGDALPRGWKLMLSNKRRASYFWLDCTGYISPNGQQFMSCKEVSSYLLSKEVQDANQTSFGHVDGHIQSTNVISFENAADSTIKYDKIGDDLISRSALPVSDSVNHEKTQTSFGHVDGHIQSTNIISFENAADSTIKYDKNGDDLISRSALPVPDSVKHEKPPTTLMEGIPSQVQTIEKYKCHKCTMEYKESDELLQHLLSFHRRESKKIRQESSMHEEAIIKNGKYECQFCLKTFEGRHCYNVHLGNHIKDYFKRFEASGGLTIQRSTVSPAIAVHSNVLEMQVSNELITGSVATHSCNQTNAEIRSDVPSCELKENSKVEESSSAKKDIVFSMTNDYSKKINEATEFAAVELNVCSGYESVLSKNENSSTSKFSYETAIRKSNNDQLKNIGNQEDCSQNCLLAAVERSPTGAALNNEDQAISNSIDKHDPERELPVVSFKENSLGGENVNDKLLCSTIDGMKLDKKGFGMKEKLRTVSGYSALQKGVTANMKEQRSSEGSSFVSRGSERRYSSLNNVDGLSTSMALEMTHERGSKEDLSLFLDQKTCLWNGKVNQVTTSSVADSGFYELCKSRNDVQTVGCNNNRTLTVEDTVTRREPESSLESCAVTESWNEHSGLAKNATNATPRSSRKKFWQEKESNGSQLTLFGGSQSFGFENNAVKVPNCGSGFANHDEVQYSKNRGFSKGDNLAVGSGANVKLERNANNFLLGPSSNERTFSMEDKEVLMGTSDYLLQDRKFEGQSCNVQKLNNENNVNMISFLTMDQRKNKEVQSSCAGEPRLAFHHSHMQQNVDIGKNTMETNCLKGSSRLNYGNQQKSVMEDNKTGLYSSTLDELKRASIESLFGPSCGEQDFNVESNLNMGLAGQSQEKPKLEDIYLSKNEPAIGFSSHPQARENATCEFMWRTDEDLLSSFADTSSGCFPTYDIMSDKAESDLFSEKFSGISGFEGLRSGGMENMEYNFMTPHLDKSKAFSYGADIGEGLDSSVWVEKPLLPKTTSRRYVRTFCVWCRNEFCYETFESEAQVSSSGLSCAACKAKFSGQFNLL